MKYRAVILQSLSSIPLFRHCAESPVRRCKFSFPSLNPFGRSPVRSFGSVPRFFTNPVTQQSIHLILLALFIAIAYYPSLDVPLNFDDFPNIVANPAVHPQKAADLINALHSPVSTTRPLALFSFAVNYLFGNLDVFGYHLINILLHILNAILLYKITAALPHRPNSEPDKIKTTYAKQALAFWSAALWAMNPVQTQAVTYIVQRMTSMAAFFYLTAIYTFIRWRRKKLSGLTAFVLITVCFLLGMASKEIVITLPLALLLLDSLCFSSLRINRLHVIVGIGSLLALTGICVFYLRDGFPDWLIRYPNRSFSPWERIMTEWRVVWHYLSLFSLPLPKRLHLAYDPVVSRGLLQPWTTLAGLCAILSTLILAWRRRNALPACVFAIFFFFLALAVESSFLNLELAFIHRLYLPTAFLVFALLVCLPSAFLRRGSIVLFLVLALWSFWTITRNAEWTRTDTFWAADLQRGAAPGRAFNNKAAALIDSGNYKEAVDLIEQGLENAATQEEKKGLLYNLGTAFFLLQKYDEALPVFQKVASEYEPIRQTYLFIGQCYLLQGKKDKARNLAAELLAVEETRYLGKILTANLLSAEGKYTEAEELLKGAMAEEDQGLLDQQLKLRLELASIYLRHEKFKEAYDTYLEIIQLFPQNYFAWKQIYLMLRAGGDVKGASVVKRFLDAKGVRLEGEESDED
jgi:tetratricopeptide (TPR) repeat protein